MANNLFISYALSDPERTAPVNETIQSLGPWAKVHLSQFYVSAGLSAEEAANQIWASMSPNDKLLVIDAANNQAHWFNMPDDVARQMRHYWCA